MSPVHTFSCRITVHVNFLQKFIGCHFIQTVTKKHTSNTIMQLPFITDNPSCEPRMFRIEEKYSMMMALFRTEVLVSLCPQHILGKAYCFALSVRLSVRPSVHRHTSFLPNNYDFRFCTITSEPYSCVFL